VQKKIVFSVLDNKSLFIETQHKNFENIASPTQFSTSFSFFQNLSKIFFGGLAYENLKSEKC
jgi:hypothetical protein